MAGTITTQAEPEAMAEMNATPLIDVMLVLLIMLILTIPLQHHAVTLNMGGGPSDAKPAEVVTVDIDFDGTVAWNGAAEPERGSWEAKLRQIGLLAADVQPEVHVRPSKLAEYKTVAAVLAAAQRAGVVKIGVIGAEQFM